MNVVQLLSIFLVLLELSCQSAGKNHSRGRSNEIMQNGFVFAAPENPLNWNRINVDHAIIFNRVDPENLIPSFHHKAYLAAEYGFIDDLNSDSNEVIRQMEKIKLEKLSTGNRTIVRSLSSPIEINGARCMRSDWQVREVVPYKKMDLEYHLYIDGVFCIHPDDKQRFINLTYTQNVIKGKPPIPLAVDGELFLNGLKFQSLK